MSAPAGRSGQVANGGHFGHIPSMPLYNDKMPHQMHHHRLAGDVWRGAGATFVNLSNIYLRADGNC